MLVWNRVKCAWDTWHGSRAAWLKLPHIAGAVGACLASGLVLHSLPLGPSDSGIARESIDKPSTHIAPSTTYIAIPNQFGNYGYTNGNYFPSLYNAPILNLATPINTPSINLVPPITNLPLPPINNQPPPINNQPPPINLPSPPTKVPEPSSFYVLITACLMVVFIKKRLS
jgi:hypothetical protein